MCTAFGDRGGWGRGSTHPAGQKINMVARWFDHHMEMQHSKDRFAQTLMTAEKKVWPITGPTAEWSGWQQRTWNHNLNEADPDHA